MTPYRVLHVADDPESLDRSVAALERDAAMTVRGETSPGTALDLLDGDHDVDCLVSEYALPGMDGLELLRRVRDRHPALPFVLFTGRGSETIASRATAAGVTEYIPRRDDEDSFDRLIDSVRDHATQYRRDRRDRQRRRARSHRRDERLAQYETILETLPVGVAVLDEDATMEWVNEAFWEAFDSTEGDLVGRPFPELIEKGLIDPAIAERYVDAVRTLLSSRTDDDRVPVEITVHPPHEDGSREYEGIVALQPLEEGQYNGTVNAFFDVTDRERRQRELEQYKVAMETVPDGVFMLDEEGTMTRVNRAWADIVGYDPDELVGMPFEDLVDAGVVDRAVVETYLDLLPGLVSSETDRTKAKFTTRAVRIPDGSERAYEVHIGLIPADEGFQGVAGVVRDITDKIDQQERLERENERLDEFASIVSHDLRNPLSIARGFTEIAQETDDTAPLDRVVTALDRMDAIVGDVLELARQGAAIQSTTPVALADRFAAAWATVETADATMQVDCDDDIRVAADAPRLQQVFENLVRNSVEHGSTGSRPQADDSVAYGATDTADDDRPPVTIRLGVLDDGTGFYVEDDGPGIPESARADVFAAGYSESTDGTGTGLGLNIVEQIVEAHGWRIDVTDGTDGGARFEVTGVEFVD